MRCISALHFSTMIAVIAHYTYSGRLYFSLFNDVCVFLIGQELKKLRFFIDFFHFYFLNSDISVIHRLLRLEVDNKGDYLRKRDIISKNGELSSCEPNTKCRVSS